MDVERKQLQLAASNGLGEWLQTFDWDCFATFTYADQALGRPLLAVDRASKFLRRDSPCPTASFFLAGEVAGWDSRHAHAHGLIKFTPNWGTGLHRSVWECWRSKQKSFARFETPQGRGLAAALYCAKYLVKTTEPEWTISGTPVRLSEL